MNCEFVPQVKFATNHLAKHACTNTKDSDVLLVGFCPTYCGYNEKKVGRVQNGSNGDTTRLLSTISGDEGYDSAYDLVSEVVSTRMGTCIYQVACIMQRE